MARIRPTKHPMPAQPPEERIKNFDEVTHGYSEDVAVQEALRCLQCKNPRCVEGLPLVAPSTSPALFLKYVKKDFQGAH